MCFAGCLNLNVFCCKTCQFWKRCRWYKTRWELLVSVWWHYIVITALPATKMVLIGGAMPAMSLSQHPGILASSWPNASTLMNGQCLDSLPMSASRCTCSQPNHLLLLILILRSLCGTLFLHLLYVQNAVVYRLAKGLIRSGLCVLFRVLWCRRNAVDAAGIWTVFFCISSAWIRLVCWD